MSTNRNLDKVCIAAVIVTVLITVLFMNDASLGISVMADEESGSSEFTDNDLDADWSREDAAAITLSGDSAEISGNGAYFADGNLYISYAGKYVIEGTLEDGSIIVDAEGDDKIWLLFDGVQLTCGDDAALQILQAGKVFLTLAEGSENTILTGKTASVSESETADSSGYSEAAVSAGHDGAVYAKDDLTIIGSGSLSVKTSYQHGIVCNDDFVMTGGHVTVEAPEDGIHANDSVRLTSMDLDITAGDDGITVSNDDSTDYLYMESGTVTIAECYEGLEATAVTIAGGDISVTCSDDGINARGTDSASGVRITGGSVYINNPSGRDADGIDSNGSIFIDGGTVIVDLTGESMNCPIDCGTENGGIIEINGGTVTACGGAGMAEGVSATSLQCSIQCFLTGADGSTSGENVTEENSGDGSGGVTKDSGNLTVTLRDSNGSLILEETMQNSFSSVILSSPDLKTGETYTIACGDETAELTLSGTVTVEGGAAAGGGMAGGMDGKAGHMGRKFDMESSEDAAAQGSDTEGGESPMGQRPDAESGEGPMGQRPDAEGDEDTMRQGPGTDSENRTGPRREEGNSDSQEESTFIPGEETWLILGLSAAALLVVLLTAFRFRGRWIS